MVIRTDYDKFAEKYDEDRKDRVHAPNGFIQARLDAGATGLAVLDLGCGPGRWLAAQTAHFDGRPVRWVGLEPFGGMIALARRNASAAELVQGRAEAIPFDASSFDLVISTVSFHHFEDKDKSLDEVVRVLRPNGIFGLGNIDPFRMRLWSPYVFFPETWATDESWFWPVDRLVEALKQRGLSVESSVNTGKSGTTVAAILAEAKRRTLSQYATLDDDALARGIERLRAIVSQEPGREHADEWAWLNLTARKEGG